MASCVSAPVAPPEAISPSELLAKQDFFDGKVVVVKGWMTYGFEDSNIRDCLRDDKKCAQPKTCVGVDIPVSMYPERFDETYVVIEATFHKNPRNNRVLLSTCVPLLYVDQGKPPVEASEFPPQRPR